jgi:hypothetical protein
MTYNLIILTASIALITIAEYCIIIKRIVTQNNLNVVAQTQSKSKISNQ